MRIATAITIILASAFVACGGTTFSSDSSSSRDGGAHGGAPSTGGGSSAGATGSGGAHGGSPNAGGGPASGGHPSAGGAPSSGGHQSAGGFDNSGGLQGSGGLPNSGGLQGAGGFQGSGGFQNSGGLQGSGGFQGSGGVQGSGGLQGSGGGGGSCNATTCGPYYTCCGNVCVNTSNDPHHCGSCDNACGTDNPFCEGGQCTQPPCTPPPGSGVCAPNSVCCGTTCCAVGEICCSVTANFTTIGCYDPSKTGGTCPLGCPLCVCASPDTPIATPEGERAIASLRVGDHVLSVDGGHVVDVPVLEVHKNPAKNHHVVRVELESGSVLEISAPHPTADGRTFGDLRANDLLGGVKIERVTVIPYAAAFTYDILPASDSGTYYAGGVLIGSTLGGTALSSGTRDFASMSF